ncbi:hypothetical protein [uncultured Tateyamaria sp.]|uniref:hypothetical protein n=1 Tax=Tateyamaria sp. 1078 TaxID=3417464 RepID=UPI00261706CC|nr:hypothetical protein [uncultured Tateyamaria sp.]
MHDTPTPAAQQAIGPFSALKSDEQRVVAEAAKIVVAEIDRHVDRRERKVVKLFDDQATFQVDQTALDAIAVMFMSMDGLTAEARRKLIADLRRVQKQACNDVAFSTAISLAALPENAEHVTLFAGKALPDLDAGFDRYIARIQDKAKKGPHEAAYHLASLFAQFGMPVSASRRSRFVHVLGDVFRAWGVSFDPKNAAQSLTRSK